MPHRSRHAAGRIRTARLEQAFSIVEVVIAMVLLVAVCSGVAVAMLSGTRVQSSSRVRSHIDQVGSAVVERLESTKGWAESCTPNCLLHAGSPRSLAPPVSARRSSTTLDLSDLTRDEQLGVDWEIRVTGVGTDSPADGLASSAQGDKDGQTPDLVTVYVDIGLASAADSARLMGARSIRLTRTFDARGKVATGSLVVEACRVVNQVDERVPIDGCSGSTRYFKMPTCPTSTPCTSYNSALPLAPSERNPNALMGVRRTTTSFQIRSLSTGIVRSSSSARASGGSYLFESLPAGTYVLERVSAPSGTDVWPSHIRPAKGQITVQNGARAAALLAFRPPERVSSSAFNVTRDVGFLDWRPATNSETKAPVTVSYAVEGGGYGGYMWGDATQYATSVVTEVRHYLRPSIHYEEWGGSGVSFDIDVGAEPTGRAHKEIGAGVYEPIEGSGHANNRRNTGNHRHTVTVDGIAPGLNTPPKTSSRSARIVNPPATVWAYPTGGTTMNGVKIRTPGECYTTVSASYPGRSGSLIGIGTPDVWSQGPNTSVNSTRSEDDCDTSSMFWPPSGARLIGRSFGIMDCTITNTVAWYVDANAADDNMDNPAEHKRYKYDPSVKDHYSLTSCTGYPEPLSCRDAGGLNCGPAVHFTAKMSVGDNISIPPQPTKFHGGFHSST